MNHTDPTHTETTEYTLWIGGDSQTIRGPRRALDAYLDAERVYGHAVVQLCHDGYDIVSDEGFSDALYRADEVSR